MRMAIHVGCSHHHLARSGRAAQDDAALLCFAQNGDVQSAVGRVRMQMPAHDWHMKFFYCALHASQDLLCYLLVVHGEHIHHGHRPAAHSRDIVHIDQDGTVAGPLRIDLHELGPDAVRRQEHDLLPVVNHSRILTKGGNDALGLYGKELHEAAYLLFASDAYKSSQLGCQRLQIHRRYIEAHIKNR